MRNAAGHNFMCFSILFSLPQISVTYFPSAVLFIPPAITAAVGFLS